MKIKLICIAFLACFVSCSAPGTINALSGDKVRIELQTIDDLYRFTTYNDSRVPLVSAHRGGPEAGFPENALETFQHAAAKQPLIIEFDIAMSKDSILVLMHDDKLDRTTTGAGLVGDYTLEELRDLRLKDNDGLVTKYQIPTLKEVLKWGKGKVVYTLDVKRGVPYEMVLEEIRDAGAEPYSIFITYSADQAARVHQLAPDLMISASIRKPEDLLRLNDMGVPDNRIVAFVGISEPDPETYEFLHEHGILCILGTMGNLDNQAEARGDVVYYDFIDRGADILSTDRHNEAGLQLQKYRSDRQLASPYIR